MRAITFVVFLLATGCVGQIDNPGGDDDDGPGVAARTQFVENVHPITARCSGAACHSIDATASSAIGHFYSPDASTTYDTITVKPSIVATFSSIAPIITKIDAGHQGIVYSGADRTAIANWLAQEVIERQDDPSAPPPLDPAEVLKAWSACMTIENFNAALMPEKWGGLAASSGQACQNCHVSGLAGFTASTQAEIYFGLITSSMSQHLKYFSVNGNKAIINMGALNNAGLSIVDHPRFDPVNNAGIPALQSFYDLTLAAQTAAGAAGCGPAKINAP